MGIGFDGTFAIALYTLSAFVMVVVAPYCYWKRNDAAFAFAAALFALACLAAGWAADATKCDNCHTPADYHKMYIKKEHGGPPPPEVHVP